MTDMRFLIMQHLPASILERWLGQFVNPGCQFLESLWRRSEAVELGYDGPNQRRRIIHVIDHYDLLPDGVGGYDLVIDETYLWLCSMLPADEAGRYVHRLATILSNRGWRRIAAETWRLNDLSFTIEVGGRHPLDANGDRFFPIGYRTVICTLVSDGMPKDRINQQSPWDVNGLGLRRPGTRVDDPLLITNLHDLLRYFPAQVEIGGGPSIEVGVPPLNFMHRAYGLYTTDDTRFAYGDSDDLLADLLSDPDAFFRERAGVPYAHALTATPSLFYRTLSELSGRGLVRGPILTNNFDRLCHTVGLEEFNVRRYTNATYIPKVNWLPEVRTLIVVGSHADRRLIQADARRQGLQVIFVDPESYFDHAGRRVHYPLEEIRPEDILIPMTGSEFAHELRRVFGWSALA